MEFSVGVGSSAPWEMPLKAKPEPLSPGAGWMSAWPQMISSVAMETTTTAPPLLSDPYNLSLRTDGGLFAGTLDIFFQTFYTNGSHAGRGRTAGVITMAVIGAQFFTSCHLPVHFFCAISISYLTNAIYGYPCRCAVCR